MKKIYSREDVCIGCRLCEVHCAVQHSKSGDIVKAFRRETPRPQSRLVVEEHENLSFGIQCRHCEDPICVFSCISGAMQRNPDGTVLPDKDRCVGCWTCVMVCPYGAIKRSPGDEHVAQKCDMCPGLEVPACVANCPNGALTLEETK
jgi:anaerobic carbon-monoxide dehydrogenase iron sulfur subunit